MATHPTPVTVPLSALHSNTVPLSTLEEAFGPTSLGILLVTDLPPNYSQLRTRLLSLSSYLANLPTSELEKLENAAANYAIGWSRGKETLADGRYDTLKGSYYAQPIHDEALEAKGRQLFPNAKEFVTPNVWPNEDVLPGFEKVFEELCQMIVEVAAVVARNCDRFGEAKLEGYRKGTLEGVVRGSVCTKARLLHYFPAPESATTNGDSSNDDAWCATHKDLGALTGLTGQMFVDETQHPPTPSHNSSNPFPDLPELPTHPDPTAGLWICDRAGRRTQMHIPHDALAFQTGEVLETLTQGAFKAVPHFVRAGKGGPGVARNTLAVFTQPNLWDDVGGRSFADVGRENLGKGV